MEGKYKANFVEEIVECLFILIGEVVLALLD